jgi:hypothetical protein
LFRSLYDSFAEASDDALRSHLITRLHFAATGAKQVIAAFRDTILFANLQKSDYNAPDMTVKEETKSKASDYGAVIRDVFGPRAPQQVRPSASSKVFMWPLSKGVTAEVRFSGGEVQKIHLDLLAKYLELAKTAMETEDEEGPSS